MRFEAVIERENFDTAAGTNEVDVRPPVGHIWLLDTIDISHNDTVNRAFTMEFHESTALGSSSTIFLNSTHITIIKNLRTQIWPIWHDVSGQEQDHVFYFGQLQLDHDHFIRLSGLAFAVDKIITTSFAFRRVI